jgi:hypothetical protein
MAFVAHFARCALTGRVLDAPKNTQANAARKNPIPPLPDYL